LVTKTEPSQHRQETRIKEETGCGERLRNFSFSEKEKEKGLDL